VNEPTDPFEALATPLEPVQPPADFAARLRARLAERLGLARAAGDPPSTRAPSTDDLPTIELPRRATMATTDSASTPTASTGTAAASIQVVTPYLAVHDGAAALAFYEDAFGAEVTMRIVGDDGRLGHSEFGIGGARFYLSDEHPDIGVVGPRSLGNTSVTLHLDVDDVDAVFARATAAGATTLAEPADQPHGARHCTLVDPFGHRWMLSQQVGTLAAEDLERRMGDAGFRVETSAAAASPTAAGSATTGGIWAAVNTPDAPAMIRLMVEVFGFTEQLVVPGEQADVVEHSQILWPEGGVVQVATSDRPGNPFSERPIGSESLYVITADPDAVYQRCLAAGLEVVGEPMAPEYDPGGSVFSVRDHEGNLWSFGTYAGEA